MHLSILVFCGINSSGKGKWHCCEWFQIIQDMCLDLKPVHPTPCPTVQILSTISSKVTGWPLGPIWRRLSATVRKKILQYINLDYLSCVLESCSLLQPVLMSTQINAWKEGPKHPSAGFLQAHRLSSGSCVRIRIFNQVFHTWEFSIFQHISSTLLNQMAKDD